jgi:serine protease
MRIGKLLKNLKVRALCGLAFLITCLSLPAHAEPWKLLPDEPEALNELIVLLAPPSQGPSIQQVVAGVASRRGLDRAFQAGNPLSARPALTHRRSAALALADDPEEPRSRLERYVVLRYPEGTDLDDVMAELARSPHVLHVEKNVLFSLSAVTPNDPLFSEQWGHFTLALPNAWSREKGHAYVGFIDTGLQADHPDLRPFATHLEQNGVCSYTGTTFEGGNFRPQFSWNFFANRCNVDERIQFNGAGHGTHVAGIVGATPNNGIGVSGVCWNCSLMMTTPRFASDDSLFLESAADAMTFLVDNGTQAVSMSWGIADLDCSGATDGLGMFCQALAYAEQRDVALMAAPGNDKTPIEFPARDARVLSVGGIESDGGFWDRADEGGTCPCNWANRPISWNGLCAATPTFECGSNFTNGLPNAPETQDLVAPAEAVLSSFYTDMSWNTFLGCADSTHPATGYGLCTGTSMASPYVMGVIGVLRSANPLLSKGAIRDALVKNASRANAWDSRYGYGAPNVDASVSAALGRSGGQTLRNRLTPLFALYSSGAGAHLYTTVPQMASAAYWDPVTPYAPAFTFPVTPPAVPGYAAYPGTQCQVGPCFDVQPRASVYLLTSDAAPWTGAPALIPLYRMSYRGAWNGNPNNRSFFYTTEKSGVEAGKSIGYAIDGIEGYLFPRATTGSVCTVPGTTRLLRLYNSQIDDYALLPESQEQAHRNAGYASQSGLNDWLGCVYPNVDSDGDTVVNGFEDLAGTNPLASDTDCDNLSDGEELLVYDSNGYGDPRQGSCVGLNRLIRDSFSGSSGAVQGRATETGGVTWTALPAARVEGGRVIDGASIAGVPFNPSLIGGNPTVAVTADVDPSLSAWVGAGFADQATAPYWSSGKIWALVRSTGNYSVFTPAGEVTGTIPGTPVNGFHKLKVQYTPSTRQAVVLINNVQVFSQILAVAPDIRYAGFHMYQSAGGRLDNFQVLSQGVAVISDTFSGSGSVHGRPTPVGGVTWTAQPGAVLSADAVIDGGAIAGVPFNPSTLVGNPTVAVSADADPALSDWVGVGFADQATEPYWSNGKLWVLVRSNNGYSVFTPAGQVANGTIPGAPINGFHRLLVRFTPSTLQATVSINGVQVYSQTLTTAPDIRYAGFHMYRAAEGGGKLDNFEVTATSNP